MEPKCGGKNDTLAKKLEDSSMIYNEKEELPFQMSNWEQQIKKSVK